MLGNIGFVSLIEKDLREVRQCFVHQVVVLECFTELCRWPEVAHSRYLCNASSGC